MGQKTHPFGLRVGITEAHKSRWYAPKALYGELTRALAAGHLKARIHATYPVQQIQKAVAAAAAGERDGKILIVPGAA